MQVSSSGIPIPFKNFQFIGIHTIKGFSVVSEAALLFFKFSRFFYDQMEAGNLIAFSAFASQSPAFFESNLHIWKFSVHLFWSLTEGFWALPCCMWNECKCVVVWTFFGIAFLWDWNENLAFPVLWLLLNFPNLLAYWVNLFKSIVFQDLK